MHKSASIAFTAGFVLLAARASQGGSIDFNNEPACPSLTGTSMGGPSPTSPRLLVVRYLGIVQPRDRVSQHGVAAQRALREDAARASARVQP